MRRSYSVPRKPRGEDDNYTDLSHKALGANDQEPEEAVPKDIQEEITAASSIQFAALKRREVRRRAHLTLQGHLRALCIEAERGDIDLPELDALKLLVDTARARLKMAA